ncbi:AbrB/MazE/SpoVT family DNA-binding domain-containing protein [Amycolatopsis thermalba]|uniref:AbrB/MazE/SpoVT family DNA-binding domain-containing protein n=1 Tax=Amycolatopsis thermalba TaxID=944492 RepID=A0ABY4NXN9_9PSEU|nr:MULTISPECIES: AbrB/MazE/SpoVT family DNA-binding domain-containing protein [Amycolatopsis]UQS24830.1 AbrB/MazE/SpoVT family DNA-binding domain-containing protein [Amycolatopsis thermalba]
MTGAVIKPVIPATPSPRDGHAAVGIRTARRTLPLPAMAAPRTSDVVYGMAAVDCRGRVADRTVLTALSWAPGDRLDIREAHGLLLVRRDDHGVFGVTKQGHLRLPATVRHRCGLVPGDRVLLVTDSKRGLLIVHPPAALDDLLAHRHTEVLDGDPA